MKWTWTMIRVLLTTHIDPSGWGKQTYSKRRIRYIRSLHIRLRVKRKVLRPSLLDCWAECLFSQIYKLNIFPSSLIFSFALQKLSCFVCSGKRIFQIINWIINFVVFCGNTCLTFRFPRFINFPPFWIYSVYISSNVPLY